jgi:hypothetical protein
MLPQGIYTGRAVQHKFGKSTKGTNQIAVEFEITRGDHRGQRVPWYGYFTKDAWERACQQLRYCGWRGVDIENLGPLENEVEIQVEHNEYEDKNGARKTTVRASFVNPIGGGLRMANPMSGDELRVFSAQLKAKLAQHPVPEMASAPPSRGVDEPPPPADDDIPF